MDTRLSQKIYSLTSGEADAGLKAFQTIDRNKDGFLSKQEIQQYYLEAGGVTGDSANKALMAFMDKYDANMDDKINYVEFLQFIVSNSG